MRELYEPSGVESKWQKKWAEAGTFDIDITNVKDPFYLLVMFPYPSGAKLHVGHWFQYSIPDSYGRFLKMRGNDVFHPMGFDAFGLPAENYAIKTGVPPAESTKENVETMIEQYKRMGVMFDWKYQLNTSTPEYYRWTQWLFLQMHKHELAYKKEAPVNWCPTDQTVLANEQVHDGKCERCGTEVVQKNLTQWFWKITGYAQRLLDGLDELDWPEKTKLMQRNWIGRSEGAEIRFSVDMEGHEKPWEDPKALPEITVFTTRPDTLFGATYLVLAPEHALVDVITPKKHKGAVDAYRAEVKKKTELQRTDLNKVKSGVPTGAYAIHPASGEKIPVWIADYVLPQYGTGAIMAVPAHDERDWEFAKAMNLPIRTVVQAAYSKFTIIEKSLPADKIEDLKKFGTVEVKETDPDWGKFFVVTTEGKKEAQLIEFLMKHLLTKSDDGGAWYADSMGTTNLVVYPGTFFHPDAPVHMEMQLEHGRKLGIPEDQLVHDVPPYFGEGVAVFSDFLNGLSTADAKKRIIAWLEDEEKGRGRITYRLRDWLVSRQRYWGAPIPIVYDPDGKPHPVPEKHLPWLLPTDVEFKPTGKSPLTESKEFIERTEKIFGKGWTPEFDTMDTFVCSSFYELRFLMQGDAKHFVDPHMEKKLMPVDMYIGGPEHACMHLIYARFIMKALKDFGVTSHEEPFKKLVHQGLITNKGAKMSKSKGNVVSPDPLVERHGSDVFRMYLMFMGPFTDGGDWSDTGIKGIDRFVQRIWRIRENVSNKKGVQDDAAIERLLHKTVKSVTESLERLHFNTAISAMMELLNALEPLEKISKETWQTFTCLLTPLAPHLAEELWEQSGGKGFASDQDWPVFDPAKLVSDTMKIVIQVNGKLRGDVEVATTASKDDIIAQAKAHENAAKFLAEGQIRKEVYIPGKLVNFVVG